jgi:hypothetical protein
MTRPVNIITTLSPQWPHLYVNIVISLNHLLERRRGEGCDIERERRERIGDKEAQKADNEPPTHEILRKRNGLVGLGLVLGRNETQNHKRNAADKDPR